MAVSSRALGILLHPTSLPGPFAIGDLGSEAHRFLEVLRGSGATYWQMLPLGPPGQGNSPYQARSSFAGHPLLVPLEPLVEEGLLHESELERVESGFAADFEAAARLRMRALRAAYARWRPDDEFERFRSGAEWWLRDYALFAALKERDPRGWWEWPPELARREPGALARVEEELRNEVQFQAFIQFRFERAWSSLRSRARALGVRLIGDVPFFPALDSADVWANQWAFKLDEHGRPLFVAGVPPDAFSATGQLWGNPVYRWEALRERGYSWWLQRLRRTFELFDVTRIDHFRGFAAAWEIPAGSPTAVEGSWVPGPGFEFFEQVRAELGDMEIIVEDLGLITEDVRELQRRVGYPGMYVLQFAFDSDARNPYLPHNHERNAVVYTGTHDNDTTRGWWEQLPDERRQYVLRYLGYEPADVVDAFARLALASVANLAVLPWQDVLGLGSEARMNVPGRPEGNWGWRFRWEQVPRGRVEWLAHLAELYGRGG